MPDEYTDAKLYELFGGWIGLQKTPARIVLRHRLRLIADAAVEYEQEQKTKREQQEEERKLKAAQSKR